MKRPESTTEKRTPFKMRKSVDHDEVYRDLLDGFRPVDVARKYRISNVWVHQIKKRKQLEAEKLQAKLNAIEV